MKKRVLEVCCGDIESVMVAKKGGAYRVELCSGLSEGGLTPSQALIRSAVKSGIESVNVLIRPRGGDFLYSDVELELMEQDMKDALDNGATGLVFGILSADGRIDKSACRRLIDSARRYAVETGKNSPTFTFHRAFDVSKDPVESLEDIIESGFDYLLTSGMNKNAFAGIPVLSDLVRQAAGRINIIAGGGITPGNATQIIEETNVPLIHSTARRNIESKMEFRRAVSMGSSDLDEYSIFRTSGEIVADLMKRLLLFLLIITCSVSAFPLSREESLDFLINSLQYPDSVDYSRGFYEKNVDASFRARSEMPWGKDVPDREFLHFVLPVRVNNEALDSARWIFYEELKDRVKDLTMEEAILEVNHWCHEKVTYKPSDGRTSSPLSTLSQAIGRCGEESTFTVAALRSVGIPARQIYTPRWAHTDDNHAWVEAWANGKWYFIGACEPEPVLNLAWFNEPSSRGLLMTTNVTGNYNGEEEILSRDDVITRINVTSNYAPVSSLPVLVSYPDGTPAENVTVNFCIYNYAEFYPAVSKTTDKNGLASLTAGLGDFIVWASDGENFGFAKANPKDFLQKGSAPLDIILDKDGRYIGEFDFNIVPPAAGVNKISVPDDLKNENNIRLSREDSVRNAYTSTFATDEEIDGISLRLGIDRAALGKILKEARGNHSILVNAIESLPAEKKDDAVALLLSITEKDRRDISEEALRNHVLETIPKEDIIPVKGLSPQEPDSIYYQYVLNPRIENEFIFPWRDYIRDYFSPEDKARFRNNPLEIADWIIKNVDLSEKGNSSNLRINPASVVRHLKSNGISQKISFVAICRSMGIPARINSVTGIPQFLSLENKWTDVDFGGEETLADHNRNGWIQIDFTPEGYVKDPKYYSQFTISRISDGIPRLLEFSEDATVSSHFNNPVELESGQYILTSGQRLADGGVLSHSLIFRINPGDTVAVPLRVRADDSALSVIGSLNAENIYHDLESDSDKSILSTTGRGYYVVGFISPNHEPSAHAINDLSAIFRDLENDGRTIMLLFEDSGNAARFNKSYFKDIPQNVVFGIDNDGISRKEVLSSLHMEGSPDPVFVVADSFNRIVWVSSGYNIGLGEKIYSVLSRLK